MKRLDHFVGRKVMDISHGVVYLIGDVEIHLGKTPKIPKGLIPELVYISTIYDPNQTQLVFNTIEDGHLGKNEWRIPFKDSSKVKIKEGNESYTLAEVDRPLDSTLPKYPEERDADGPDSEYFENLEKELLAIEERNVKEEEDAIKREKEHQRQLEQQKKEAILELQEQERLQKQAETAENNGNKS